MPASVDVSKSLSSVRPAHLLSRDEWQLSNVNTQRGTLKLFVALVGLLLAMWGYVLFGATVFMLLEGTVKRPTPKPQIARLKALDKLETLFRAGKGRLDQTDTTFRREADKVLTVYDKILIKAINEGWQYGVSFEEEWNWKAAVLFSASLVTTVGYGNIVPTTSLGRLFTIVYASVGIPFCLVCIGLMGTIMARGFKAMALYLFEDSVTEEGLAYIPLSVSSSVMFSYLFAGAVLFRVVGPGWTFLESFYFCFITLSTIGLGDFVYGGDESTGRSFVASVAYLLLGLALLSMCFNLMQEQAAYKLHRCLSCLRRKLVAIFDRIFGLS